MAKLTEQDRRALSDSTRITEVFLGATVKDDFESYREKVRDAVNLQPMVKLFLQEQWPEGARGIVELCRKRLLKDSNAYIGIFGHRYGWIPDGYKRSITHLECEWAFMRWPKDLPAPIFIFLPETGSDADAKMRKRAKAFAGRGLPQSPQEAEAFQTTSTRIPSMGEATEPQHHGILNRRPIMCQGRHVHSQLE